VGVRSEDQVDTDDDHDDTSDNMGIFSLRKRHGAESITPDCLSIEDMASEMASEMSSADAMSTLKQFEEMHYLDPNLPLDELAEISTVLNSGNAEKGVEIEQILVEDNSPYPEVCHCLSLSGILPLPLWIASYRLNLPY
jgi:hypothetical protein